MGYKDITAGKKEATLIAARFVRTEPKPGEKGKVAMECVFQFVEPSTGEPETIRHNFWWTPKAAERSMKTLVEVLGYNGNDRPQTDGTLSLTESFTHNDLVQLVIEPQEYQGKTSMKVSWVNSLGGGGYANCEPEALKSELKEIDFKGLFLAAKKSFDGGAAPKKPVAVAKPKTAKKSDVVTDDEVPF